MITNIYSVFDRVSGIFGEPFYMLKDELAIRRFNYVMQNSQMVALDCDLYKLGTYDCEHGIINSCQPVFIKRYEEV